MNKFMFDSVQDIINQKKELEVINECEFEVIKNKNGTLTLIDNLGANLGDIENQVFYNYDEILNRLEGSYLRDYGICE